MKKYRTIRLVSMAMCLLLAAACSQQPPQPLPESPPPLPLPAGQTVLVEFPADGQWHSSGFMACAGDILLFEARGEAADSEPTAILFHIGRTMTQTLSPGSKQKVTRRGEIKFRVAPRRLGPIQGSTVTIAIHNQKRN